MTADMIVTGIAFTWTGMVIAISFLEAPLKFRAPGVTLQIGLGIGRIVFRALNSVEAVFASVLSALLVMTAVSTGVPAWGPSAIALVVLLLVQLLVIRPVLSRRSDRVLAGENPPRSRAHLFYVATEALKLIGLVTTAILALPH